MECLEIDLERGRNHLLMDVVALFRRWLRVTKKRGIVEKYKIALSLQHVPGQSSSSSACPNRTLPSETFRPLFQPIYTTFSKYIKLLFGQKVGSSRHIPIHRYRGLLFFLITRVWLCHHEGLRGAESEHFRRQCTTLLYSQPGGEVIRQFKSASYVWQQQ